MTGVPHSLRLAAAAFVLLLPCSALSQNAPAPVTGPVQDIPEGKPSMVPTVVYAEAEPWPEGTKPKPASGLSVQSFAHGLKHPRWLYVLPNGDVLVAEAATEPSESWSPKALVMNYVQRRVGAVTENANRISILRDINGDGVADQNSVLLEGLRQPFGMALIDDKLYVANTDSVVVFPYKTGDTRIADKGRKIIDLPVGHHWTRNLLPSADGKKLYVTVGSGSNIAENGIDKEEGRATILELDLASEQSRIFASGLRNANGMGFDPNGILWTVVNERDELGDETPPDYLTSVKDGGFYGWPYSYWGKRVDTRVQPQRPDLVEKAIMPDYALGGHTAPLGLTFDNNSALPAPYRGGAFIGLHGSWNRSDLSGYKVVFVKFADGKPSGQPVEVLTGFLDDKKAKAFGRPVGVAFDKSGALLVADDAGNRIWRVTGSSESGTR